MYTIGFGYYPYCQICRRFFFFNQIRCFFQQSSNDWSQYFASEQADIVLIQEPYQYVVKLLDDIGDRIFHHIGTAKVRAYIFITN